MRRERKGGKRNTRNMTERVRWFSVRLNVNCYCTNIQERKKKKKDKKKKRSKEDKDM